MTEQTFEITTIDGTADAVLVAPPPETGTWPGVLFLTDIGGIRPATVEMASRLSAAGYIVLMPNLFYRTSRPPVFDAPFKAGDPAMMARLHELAGPLTPETMERDAAVYIDVLTSQPHVAPGPVGVVGHCFSGKMALRAAAARPDRVGAVASLHGGGLWTDKPDSPHLVLPRVKARLYFGHAVNDSSMSADAIANFDVALAEWGGAYTSEVYDGAFHGWTAPDSPVFNEAQADHAFQKLTSLFMGALA